MLKGFDKKRIIILLWVIILALAGIYLILDDLGVRAKNEQFVSAWVNHEQELISICQIDYNEYVKERNIQWVKDFNLLMNP